MARYQYRLAGELGWMSNSGNALLAISNPLSSGKKLTIRSFEISNHTSTTGAPTTAAPTMLRLARATVAGGVVITPTRCDTNAAAWPSTVRILRRATVASPTVLGRFAVAKQLGQASLSWLGRRSPRRLGLLRSRPRKDAAIEGIVVRAGEGIALYAEVLNNSIPVRVTATIVRSGSPNRLYHARYFANIISADEAVFAIENQAGSGETIVLRDIAIEEVGTFDSPYFQVVPIGAVVEGESAEVPPLLKLDTSSPDPTTWIKIQQDVPILPFGQPENALADSSTGSPKGFNYLKTKDFLGPAFRTIFPEQVAFRVGAMPDVFGRAQWFSELGLRGGGITIREGEGIALVSGAETAAGATAAVGCSGWSSFEYGVTIDVEPKLSPVLTITGLQNPSEVRVFDGGTTTEVAGQENVTSGTFTWMFDPEETPVVDIAVLSLNYQNIRLPGTALSLADLTIPVQQQVDRNYANA